MKIRIQTVGKKEQDFYLTVKPTTTISKIKICVSIIYAIPTYRLSLIQGDNVLEDQNTISFYNLKDNTQLLLVIEPYVIRIILGTATGETLIFRVEPSLLVSDFKLMIQRKTGTPRLHQRLLHEGTLLRDEDRLEVYDIDDGDNIDILRRMAGS